MYMYISPIPVSNAATSTTAVTNIDEFWQTFGLNHDAAIL